LPPPHPHRPIKLLSRFDAVGTASTRLRDCFDGWGWILLTFYKMGRMQNAAREQAAIDIGGVSSAT